MSEFAAKSCEACQAGASPADAASRSAFLDAHPDWVVEDVQGVPQLVRVYSFPDFEAAVTFTNAIAMMAEEEDHHPAITTEWGRVTLRWWTHKIKDLHRNDLIAAAKSDVIYAAD